MLRIVYFILVCCAAATGLETAKKRALASLWNNCGAKSDVLELQALRMVPEMPLRGKRFSVEVKGVLREAIAEGAYVNVRVSIGKLAVFNRRLSLCGVLRNFHEPTVPTCPIGSGVLQVRHEEEIPVYVPRGPYSFQVNAFTSANRQILCLSGTLVIQ